MAMKPHGRPADVFSLGVLLLELTVGAPSEGIYAHGFTVSQLVITTCITKFSVMIENKLS